MSNRINTDQVEALVSEYVNATSDKEREEIETTLLQQTLWKARRESEDQHFAQYTEAEITTIAEAIEEGHSEASRLVRRPFVSKL